jgi:hypothetical protein
MRQQGLSKSQRYKQRRQSLSQEELQQSLTLRNDKRRISLSQIQASTSSSSSAAIGSSSSSSTAIQNINNLLNDEDEDNSFSEDSLERSFTRSPVKKKPPKTKKHPP